MTDFANLTVKKPWGFEYEIFKNEHCSIWALHINNGAETSLHCHPNKKTGLIIIHGKAECSFLNDSFWLGKLDKLMIRHGVFHAMRNIGDGELILLEIESPPNKEDIVRLKDKYGRAWTPYEDKTHYEESDIYGTGWTYLHDDSHKIFGGCDLRILNIGSDTSQLLNRKPAKFMGLAGGLYNNNYLIFGTADMADEKTLHKLASEFEPKAMKILEISLNDGKWLDEARRNFSAKCAE